MFADARRTPSLRGNIVAEDVAKVMKEENTLEELGDYLDCTVFVEMQKPDADVRRCEMFSRPTRVHCPGCPGCPAHTTRLQHVALQSKNNTPKL